MSHTGSRTQDVLRVASSCSNIQHVHLFTRYEGCVWYLHCAVLTWDGKTRMLEWTQDGKQKWYRQIKREKEKINQSTMRNRFPGQGKKEFTFLFFFFPWATRRSSLNYINLISRYLSFHGECLVLPWKQPTFASLSFSSWIPNCQIPLKLLQDTK